MPDAFTHPNAQRISRRAAVQAGAIGLLGLGVNHLAPLRAAAPALARREPRARSVIYIFLSGGLAQHESFDLKPDAPLEVRGEFNPVSTRTPGLQICEHLPELARRSHLWALCRSLTHKSNDHSNGHHIMLTGRSEMPAGFDPNKAKDSDWPSMAALANHLLPPRNNLPPAIILPEKLVHRTGRVIPGQFAGLLGARRDPWFLDASPYHPAHYGAYPEYLFHHREGPQTDNGLTFRAPNLRLPEWLAGNRLQDRLALRQELNKQRAFLDRTAEIEPFDRHWQMAVSLLTDSKVAEAFDVTAAPPRAQDSYGRNSFGWSLMLAARLVESGVRLVQVNLGNNETWDTHEAAFPNLKNLLLPPMDKAVSALLDDLQARGLLESTLVVMAGEFGRTPKISTIAGAKLPGRDHWGAVQSVWFAGGGVRGGTVIGSSDKHGGYPASDPQTPENLAATIYSALGIPAQTDWHDEQGRPYPLYHASPIAGLMG
jgi:predicted amidohydrolase